MVRAPTSRRDALVEPILDPTPYRPRPNKRRQGLLLREFAHRVGDPNTGGATRSGLMTAYRQDALRCVGTLNALGPTKAADVAQAAGVETARRLMADDHYGWFERAAPGIYQLTPKGRQAIDVYADALNQLGFARASATRRARRKANSSKAKTRAKAAA